MDINIYQRIVEVELTNAFEAVKRARVRLNNFRKQYDRLYKTVRLRQKELDSVRDFLRECNMLDYYENFVKDHRRGRDRSGVPAHHQAQGSGSVDDLPY